MCVKQDWSHILSQSIVPDKCMMECGCCFTDTDVTEMVQCGEGDLFCKECLRRYADEAIHGQGKVNGLCLSCAELVVVNIAMQLFQRTI